MIQIDCLNLSIPRASDGADNHRPRVLTWFATNHSRNFGDGITCFEPLTRTGSCLLVNCISGPKYCRRNNQEQGHCNDCSDGLKWSPSHRSRAFSIHRLPDSRPMAPPAGAPQYQRHDLRPLAPHYCYSPHLVCRIVGSEDGT